jgi:hypothetical protein
MTFEIDNDDTFDYSTEYENNSKWGIVLSAVCAVLYCNRDCKE